MPFLSTARLLTNFCAHGIKGWGGSYSFSSTSMSNEELMKCFGVIIRDGAQGLIN